MKDILKPWKELTITLSEEKEATISLIVHTIQKILNMKLQMKDLDSELGRQMKAKNKADLSKRYQDANVKVFLHMASMLDPRFKSLSYLSNEDNEATHINLRARAKQIREKRVRTQEYNREKTEKRVFSTPAYFGGN